MQPEQRLVDRSPPGFFRIDDWFESASYVSTSIGNDFPSAHSHTESRQKGEKTIRWFLSTWAKNKSIKKTVLSVQIFENAPIHFWCAVFNVHNSIHTATAQIMRVRPIAVNLDRNMTYPIKCEIDYWMRVEWISSVCVCLFEIVFVIRVNSRRCRRTS